MARHVVDKTGYLDARQKGCEELAAILWIQLKINGSCRKGQKQLLVNIVAKSRLTSAKQGTGSLDSPSDDLDYL